MEKVGRNDLCLCGSGRKYKHCCLGKDARPAETQGFTDVSIEKQLQAAIEHHQSGRFSHAAAIYQAILGEANSHPDALHLLGLAAHQQGNAESAVGLIKAAIASAPLKAVYYSNLGVVQKDRGYPNEAIACFQKAISINREYATACSNMGNAFRGQGRLEEAIACCRRSLSIDPVFAEGYSNLGLAVQDHGMVEAAIVCYLRALQIKPDFGEALSNLGIALRYQGRAAEAVICNRQALVLRPEVASTYSNLGNALRDQGRLDGAAASYRQATLLKTDYAEAYNNLGNTLKDQGDLEDAIPCFRQAVSIKPDYAEAYSNLLLALQYLHTATPAEVFAEHRRYAEHFETPLKHGWKSHLNDRDPERRLKIGYVSADFRNHAVAFFIEPIFACHDKRSVEIYCYYNHTKRDSHTERIAAYADHWCACKAMTDAQLADRIRADGIDILVDLSGHTAHNRLPVFARKPAPIQATWIGYAGTTGLSAMDYRITDAHIDPVGLSERYHTETLLRLPETTATYRPEPGCPEVNPLPALRSGELMLASLNNLTKINPPVIKLWARILHALPQARLMLGNVTEDGIRRRLTDIFAAAGINAQRLVMQPRLSMLDYLALHGQIDLALDPFPYNGGTTTFHALWMGVPVITLAGGHVAARVGVACLARVGLPEFIVHSEEEYFQRAVQSVQDLPALNRVRLSLRGRMAAASCGPETTTRYLEVAYRQIWRQWCSVPIISSGSGDGAK